MKVLIATPTSRRHEYCIDEFLDRVRNLTHPFHLYIVDTTLDKGEYFKSLKNKIDPETMTVKRYLWNPEQQNAVQMLADVKAKMRKYFLLNNYSHYFDIASDFMLPPDIIERLIRHDKDCVGCVTHMYHGDFKTPAIWKWRGKEDSGFIDMKTGLDIYNWYEVKDIHGLQRVYACAVALYKRRVMGCCQFRTHPTFIFGEDLWWFTETNDKGFEWWCDFDIRIEHTNTDWLSVPEIKKTGILLAVGPVNARGIVWHDRTGKGSPAVDEQPIPIGDKTDTVKD